MQEVIWLLSKVLHQPQKQPLYQGDKEQDRVCWKAVTLWTAVTHCFLRKSSAALSAESHLDKENIQLEGKAPYTCCDYFVYVCVVFSFSPWGVKTVNGHYYVFSLCWVFWFVSPTPSLQICGYCLLHTLLQGALREQILCADIKHRYGIIQLQIQKYASATSHFLLPQKSNSDLAWTSVQLIYIQKDSYRSSPSGISLFFAVDLYWPPLLSWKLSVYGCDGL